MTRSIKPRLICALALAIFILAGPSHLVAADQRHLALKVSIRAIDGGVAGALVRPGDPVSEGYRIELVTLRKLFVFALAVDENRRVTTLSLPGGQATEANQSLRLPQDVRGFYSVGQLSGMNDILVIASPNDLSVADGPCKTLLQQPVQGQPLPPSCAQLLSHPDRDDNAARPDFRVRRKGVLEPKQLMRCLACDVAAHSASAFAYLGKQGLAVVDFPLHFSIPPARSTSRAGEK